MSIRVNILLILSLIAALSLLFGIFGGQPLTADWELSQRIFVFIRIPHAMTAFVTGGLLGLAGALIQVLVRNPLADPYVLGVSGGAAIGTLSLMLLGFSALGLTVGAWIGSLLAIILIFIISQRKQLLLTGIAMASGFSALISLIVLNSPNDSLRSMLFWLVGDLSISHLPWVECMVLLIGLGVSLSFARDLNILIRGEKTAQALGINTSKLQWKLYLLSSLLTATAVTLAGCIGFIGLIVPHLFRLLFGYDHRILLPGSVLLGGSFLTLADLVSRTLSFPAELPVGIIMTLMGIPIFIFLLQKNSYARNL